MNLTHVNSILMVCLGNICRSPTAEFVTREIFARNGLDVELDSCGTGDWHIGHGADERMVEAARDAGYDLSPHRARQLTRDDFSRFDLILGMDRSNLENMHKLCPENYTHRTGLFTEVTGIAPPHEVPDPYYGETEDFNYVIELIEKGARALVHQLQADR